FFQAEDGIRDFHVTGVQTCALPILLLKYNKFMPVPIKFGTKTKTLPLPEDAAEDAKAEIVEVDNIINNPTPAWTKAPSELTDAEIGRASCRERAQSTVGGVRRETRV